MRNVFLGVLGILWGGGIVVSSFVGKGKVDPNTAYGSGYGAGAIAGTIFGFLLLIAGGLALFNGIRGMKEPEEPIRKALKRKKKRVED